MSFAQDTGYIPTPIEQVMRLFMAEINTQFGTSYDYDTFQGTNFYKYFYAVAQLLQESEVKTSEIFLRMQEYFVITNERIQRPSTTHPGILDVLEAAGYNASTKPPIDADAGKVYICVDVDSGASDYAARKLAINTLIKSSVVAGVITQGSEVSTITLENLQSFDFKFNLPTRTRTWLKLTMTLSDNNEYTVLTDEEVRTILLANIAARYGLGRDFEPQRYFSVVDAPWASSVLLERSSDGISYTSAIFDADYDDILTVDEADISIVTS